MFSMGVHRVEVPSSCWPGIALPHNVEYFSRERGKGVAVRIPASILYRGCIVGHLTCQVDLDQVRKTIVGLAGLCLPDEVVLPTESIHASV